MKRVHCPTCKKSIIYNPDNPWRPFCSERCKLIDLGEWASESYAIPDRPIEPDTEEAIDREQTPPYIESQTHFTHPDED